MGRARVQTAQPEEENKEIEQQQEEIEEVEELEEVEEAEEENKDEIKEEVKQPLKYLIHTPNESYSGLNCGVEFKQGKGYTVNKVIAEMFIEKGYEVEEIK